MTHLGQGVVSRPWGLVILVGLVVAAPVVLWVDEIRGDAFPESGSVAGTFGLGTIACVLALVFWPAGQAALRCDPAPMKHIGLFALVLLIAHAIVFLGLTLSDSNLYLLAYPLASAFGRYAILRSSDTE